MEGRKRDLALLNLAIDSKLRGCNVVAVRVDDVAPSGYAMDRATIRQKKTGRPMRFELTDQTRLALGVNISRTGNDVTTVDIPQKLTCGAEGLHGGRVRRSDSEPLIECST